MKSHPSQLIWRLSNRMGMASTFSTFGYVNAWEVFQAYYEENMVKDVSASNIAWIGSIQYSLVFINGLITGRLFDLGYFKIPFFAPSCLLVMCTFLVAQCTRYWEIVHQLACGMIFGPTVGVMGHWFNRKRGLALGLIRLKRPSNGRCTSLHSHLHPQLRTAAPPQRRRWWAPQPPRVQVPQYTTYCISGFITFLGLYTVLTYIDMSAESIRILPDCSFDLISIAIAFSLIGRVVGGVIADKIAIYGCVHESPRPHLQPPSSIYNPNSSSPLINLFLKPSKHSVVSGTYVSIFPFPLFSMGEIGDVGRRTGIVFAIADAGALAGPPISGAINSATGGFTAMGWCAGSTILLVVLLMVVTRRLQIRRLWGNFRLRPWPRAQAEMLYK
ncbi:hypothetical protein FB451DRAFT_1355250 [Mycena latifolia]|nr:hypothetical protein FB451DRAFT_1355250 [Mycena latifolia]